MFAQYIYSVFTLVYNDNIKGLESYFPFSQLKRKYHTTNGKY